MTELWLVRHGQTDWNQENRLQGQQDIPLNENGLKQAYRLAEQLAQIDFDVAYTSDLSRARSTAEIVLKGREIPLVVDERLRERNFGHWEGLPYEGVRVKFPDEHAARQADPVGYCIPQGESLNDVAVRLCHSAREIHHAYPTGKVLVVSHGHALSILKCLAQGDPLELFRIHRFENAEPVVTHWASPGC